MFNTCVYLHMFNMWVLRHVFNISGCLLCKHVYSFFVENLIKIMSAMNGIIPA